MIGAMLANHGSNVPFSFCRWALYPPGRVPPAVIVNVDEEDGSVNFDGPTSLQVTCSEQCTSFYDALSCVDWLLNVALVQMPCLLEH